jgi:hypothetical protein
MSLGAEALQPQLDRIQGLALMVGGVGLAVCLAAGLLRPGWLYPSYLVAYLFWIGIALGCVSFTMLHHLVGGSWGLVIRRPMESGAMTLIPMAFLFLPLILGIHTLYPWARPEVVAHDEVVRHKVAYLNTNAFVLRAALDFVLWIALAYLLNLWSSQQDLTTDDAPSRRLQQLSGPGLGVVFLSATFASIDWIMSLEPDWYSTIYGAMVITGWGLATFASMIIIAGLLADYEPMASVATPPRLNDLGNLMLAFVMLWAYLAFSQFLIIWCGDLVEEIPWYLRRTRGGWQWVALSLVVFHFFLPFFVLLFRDNKRNVRFLLYVATGIVVMHVVNLSWLVIPAGIQDPLRPWIPWGEVLLVPFAMAGIGGIWVWAFVRHLRSRPLVPLHDPAMVAVAQHEPGISQ